MYHGRILYLPFPVDLLLSQKYGLIIRAQETIHAVQSLHVVYWRTRLRPCAMQYRHFPLATSWAQRCSGAAPTVDKATFFLLQSLMLTIMLGGLPDCMLDLDAPSAEDTTEGTDVGH